MRYLLLLLLFIPSVFVNGQCTSKIRSIIEKVEAKMQKQPAYTVNFQLEMSYVGEMSQTQNGILHVDGDKFNLKLKDQSYISDGQQLCIVLPEAKELQILSLDDETGMTHLSPIQLLHQYCSDDYLSAVLGNVKEDGKDVVHLQFSPHDKTQDVFKVRISYLPQKNEIYRIKTFSKDGSRLTMTASKYEFAASHASNMFTCSSNNYPDFHVEDLR